MLFTFEIRKVSTSVMKIIKAENCILIPKTREGGGGRTFHLYFLEKRSHSTIL